MPDVFISYARVDEKYAKQLADSLKARGVRVWWDSDLIGGDVYRSKIREVIGTAAKVLVLWSRASVGSAFVIDEASEAKKLGKLIPVSIDGTDPPLGFGSLHTIQLRSAGSDVDQIIAALGNLGKASESANNAGALAPSAAGSRSRIRAVFLGIGAAVLLATGGGYWYFSDSGPNPSEVIVKPLQTAPRIALVVGNNEYLSLPPLANAERDANLVSRELERRGFKVTRKVNLDREQMIAAIKDFENVLSTVGGVGLFYFSGNAAFVDGQDIMLPVDAKKSGAKSVVTGGVNLTLLQAQIKANTTVPLIDNGSATIYSASKGQTAADGPPGGNSPFTTAFVAALADPNAELGDFFRNVRNVMEAENRQAAIVQTPYFEDSRNARFFFNKPEIDQPGGVLKIIVFDSCRDNPFKSAIVSH